MPTERWKSVRGRRMRLTRLDECCAPVEAGEECAVIVSSGFVSVAYSPEIAEAEEIEQRNAAGEICVTDPGCDSLKWVNLTLSLCVVDPDVLSFVTGSPLVLDAQGNSVGNRIQAGAVCGTNFALEVWTDIPQAVCSSTGAKQYGYFLAPCIGAGVIGDWTIENAALNLELSAKARSGSGWGTGPWDVDNTAVALPIVPGPLLTPIGADDVIDMHLTTIAPPEVTDGCEPMPPAGP